MAKVNRHKGTLIPKIKQSIFSMYDSTTAWGSNPTRTPLILFFLSNVWKSKIIYDKNCSRLLMPMLKDTRHKQEVNERIMG
ncbi:MAG: hypothetical protein O3A74_04860 [archaeon]|nr:hypothetical protein [archaeon]